MSRKAVGEAQEQEQLRSYVLPDTAWDRIASGHAGSVLALRLLPFVLLAVTVPLAFVTPLMVPYANYALVLLPAFTALVNGPIATACATIGTVALVSAGTEALGLLPFPNSIWADLPPIAVVGVLCTVLAWARNRVIIRLLDMTEVAETAQQAIMPDLPGRIGGLKISSVYRTARGSPGLIGGDFYDVQDTDFGLRAVVGDVQGHDLSTVRLTEALLGTFRERALDDPDLATLAAHMERRVRLHNRDRDEWGQTFATAAIIEISPGRDRLRTLLCGHPAPLLVRSCTYPVGGKPLPPLGLADFGIDSSVQVRDVELAPGDLVVAYTDGLVEARNPAGQTFPLFALLNAHVAAGLRDPAELRKRIRSDFVSGGYARTDDLTAMVIQIP
ncbi:PP2C family protein-serine/threonine phosphatase [Glycomyces paridis]|uniref:Serine/threonine-protein phosphatase n=1 Tax=Glycomyces paridis TaxID=2126555 RepID=A0A4S8P6P8_9ACTN|nr:PP2C family protein-serine/threonine phosphatase [Glycomyces paridis]THV25953.1 serine/threonine-protein phosphatase [Glycomyces paridis]